jgi:hypothetical protein
MHSPTADEETSLAELRDLVQRHRVCWDVFHEHAETPHGPVLIGFQIDLSGAADPKEGEEAEAVYNQLQTIAAWLTAAQGDAQHRCFIEAFDGSVHYSPRRKFRTEVVLAIDLVHGHPWETPIDSGLSVLLREMEERLTLIGAHREHW